MTVIEREVRCATICANVREARHPGHDPARWALPLIAEADRVAAGVWSLVLFDATEAGALWLPPHAGEPCHGDTMGLGGDDSIEGQSLAEAADWLNERREAYASANASCWGRVLTARDSTWSPIVVAPFSVGDRVGPPHARRIVIDGLHRSLGWALRPNPSPLLAYLAGPVERADDRHGR